MQEAADANSIFNALLGISQTFQGSTSQTADPVKESILRAESSRIGYCSALLDIVKNDGAEDNVRWLAAITLKNYIFQNWHRKLPSSSSQVYQNSGSSSGVAHGMYHGGIIEEERAHLKNILEDYFDEKHNQISTQISLSVGRIARYDYNVWPGLFEKIFAELRRNLCSLRGQRALVTMHYIIKELISKAIDRSNLAIASPEFLGILIPLWYVARERYESHEGKEEATVFCYITKCIMKLIAYGVESLVDVKIVIEGVEHTSLDFFLVQLVNTLSILYVRNSNLDEDKGVNYHKKILSSSASAIIMTQRRHSKTFFNFLGDFVRYFVNIILEESTGYAAHGLDDFKQRMIAYSAEFLTNVVNSYGISTSTHGYKELTESFGSEGGTSFSDFMFCLVSKYLAFNARDMDDWWNDAEGFVKDLEFDKSTLRKSIENLVSTLLYRLPGSMQDFAVQMNTILRQPLERLDAGDKILMYDAFEQVVGIACEAIHKDMDIQGFLFNDFLPQLVSLPFKPSNALLRGRFIWMLGKTIEYLTKRSQVLDILTMCLKDEDKVVRLLSVHSFYSLVTNTTLEDTYMSASGPAINSLFDIFSDLVEDEAKLTLLSVLTSLIEHVGVGVRPFVENIFHNYAALWRLPDICNLIRTNVLSGIHKLIAAVGTADYPELQELGLEMVRVSVDPSSPLSLYLVEDSLDLWLTIVRHAPQYNEGLGGIYTLILEKLDRDTESLHVAIDIISAYTFLGTPFLEEYGRQTIEMLTKFLFSVRYQAQVLTLDAVQNLLILQPNLAAYPFSTGTLSDMVSNLLKSNEDSNDIVESGYFCLFARIAYQSKSLFLELLHVVAKHHSHTFEDVLVAFVGKWLEKMDSVFLSLHRKLSALALVALLFDDSGFEALGQFATSILDLSCQVITEEEEIFSFPIGRDMRHSRADESLNNAVVPLHKARKRDALMHDPLNMTNMREFLKAQLSLVSEKQEPIKLQQFYSSIAEEIKRELTEIISKE